jgi:hypothetical protein
MNKRPADIQEAEKRLSALADGLRQHFTEYKPHETFVDHDLLTWLADGIAERTERNGTLDQALGLARYRGEKPSTPGKYFTLAVEVFEMRARGMSWANIAEKTGFDDQRELQRICEREMPHVIRHYVDAIARD